MIKEYIIRVDLCEYIQFLEKPFLELSRHIYGFFNLQARAAARYAFLFGGPFLYADWLKSLAQITWIYGSKTNSIAYLIF